MTTLGKNIGLWKLAEGYLWSTCATATGAIDDGSALQAHGWFESTDRTATLESLSACAQRPDQPHSCDSRDAKQLGAGIVMVAGAAELVTGIAPLTTQRTSVNVTRISDGTPSGVGVPVVQSGAVRLTTRGIEF